MVWFVGVVVLWLMGRVWCCDVVFVDLCGLCCVVFVVAYCVMWWLV